MQLGRLESRQERERKRKLKDEIRRKREGGIEEKNFKKNFVHTSCENLYQFL